MTLDVACSSLRLVIRVLEYYVSSAVYAWQNGKLDTSHRMLHSVTCNSSGKEIANRFPSRLLPELEDLA